MFDQKVISGLFRLYGSIYGADDKTLVTKIGSSFLLVFEESVVRVYGLGFNKKKLCEKFMNDYSKGLCSLGDVSDDEDLNFVYDTNNKLVSTQLGGVYTLWIITNDVGAGIIVPDQSVTELFIKQLRKDRPLVFDLIDKHLGEGYLNVLLNNSTDDNDDERIDYQSFNLIININSSVDDNFSYQAFLKLVPLKNVRYFYNLEQVDYLEDYLKHILISQQCPV